MPSPLLAFRLKAEDRAAVVEMSKLFGCANPSEFCREMLSAMCSGNPDRVQAFNAKLIHAVGEQLILKLHAPLRAISKPVPVPKKARKKRRGRRGTT